MLNRRGWVVVAVVVLLAAVPASADSTEVEMDTTVCVDRPCPIAPISAPSGTRVLSPISIIADEDYVLVNLAKDSESEEDPAPPAEDDPPPPAEEDPPPPTEDEPAATTSTRRTPEKTSTKDKPTPTSTKKKDEATSTRKAEPVTPHPRPTRTGSTTHVHPTSTSALGSKKPVETDSPDPEDSLTSTYPPSSARKKWGLAIGFMAFLTLLGVAWSYRSSLPSHLPPLNLKLLTGKGYIPLPSSPKSRRHTRRRSKPFRPTPSSLLTWARDTPSSKWTVGELDDEEGYIGESEEGYEEVGLLPSPAPGQGQGQGVKEQRSYGSFSNA